MRFAIRVCGLKRTFTGKNVVKQIMVSCCRSVRITGAALFHAVLVKRYVHITLIWEKLKDIIVSHKSASFDWNICLMAGRQPVMLLVVCFLWRKYLLNGGLKYIKIIPQYTNDVYMLNIDIFVKIKWYLLYCASCI